MSRIALVVPGLEVSGGVTAVARFLKDTVIADGRFDLRVVSLATSAHDPCNLSLLSPRTWLRGAAVRSFDWESQHCTHVGARFGELEFQRYRPRADLQRTLAGCDVIQVVCGSPAWANAVLGLGIPVAVHVATRARAERRRRDNNARGAKAWWRKVMTEITDRMDDRALRRVAAIQVMNPWMLEYAQAINAQRAVDLRCAPPGINVTLFHPCGVRDLSRDRYIICVARFNDPRKNISLLLDAFAQLPRRLRNDVRLILAGLRGPNVAFWERAAVLQVRERVSYIEKPDQDSLVRLYQQASVFALPSDEEGFGVALVEAMACGIPVVSTRSGGPDGIITDGEDGYLVPLDDAPTLAARIGQLLQDSAHNREMGRRARLTAERRYDERVAGRVFLDVWNRLTQNVKVR